MAGSASAVTGANRSSEPSKGGADVADSGVKAESEAEVVSDVSIAVIYLYR